MPDPRAEAETLRECILDLLNQFAYDTEGPALTTGGLSALEHAFGVVGWEDPHPIPNQRCDEPLCRRRADCGTPTKTGYRRTCGQHIPKEERHGR